MEGNVMDKAFDVEKKMTGIFDQSLFVFREVGISDEDGSG